jgi:tripartite-type tricarboxylate transporter receptor subunit TctC
MMKKRNAFAALLLLASGMAVSTLPASAQADWPNRPIRLIVPLGAGGSGDTLARVVADHLSNVFKQQFVVENRTGAGGLIGTQAIATSPADGYTIGITNLSTMSLIPVINPSAPYDPVKDFTHIAYIAGAPVALATNPGTNIKSFKEFVEAAKKSGKPLTFSSSGFGSDGHLMGEAIALAAKIKVEHVPYRSTAQALSDAVAGHVTFSTLTLTSTSSFIRAGTLNGIAVTSPERMPSFPDIPSFKELGHPELAGTTWFALSGPANMPKEIVEKINREVAVAIAKPEVQARLARDGFLAQPMTAAEFTKFVATDAAKWKPVVESAGLAGKGGG